jgi:3-oxoacyl-[acyl-carrier protein] reductase
MPHHDDVTQAGTSAAGTQSHVTARAYTATAPDRDRTARVVLVTGGGTGIGRAVAARFAGSGAEVIVTGRRAGPLADTAACFPARIRAVTCDNADPDQLHDLVRQLPDQIDVLVNNAGGLGSPAAEPAPSASAGERLAALAAEWNADLAANLLTAVLTTEAVTDRLADDGAVISVGSIAAVKGSDSYGAAKAALASWNLSLAADVGGRGITANVIAPGYVAATEFFGDRMTAERRDRLVAATMNRRVGRPDDIAETAYFLAGRGGRHITGQVIHVNGGAFGTR